MIQYDSNNLKNQFTFKVTNNMIRRKKLKSLLHLAVKTIPAAQANQVPAQTASHLANQILAQTNQIVEAAQTASHLTHTHLG